MFLGKIAMIFSAPASMASDATAIKVMLMNAISGGRVVALIIEKKIPAIRVKIFKIVDATE
jgi:hypothetical protein